MANLFSHKIDWNSRVVIQSMRWFQCREIPAGATDFYCYLLHKAMSEHADALIAAPDKSMPDTASPASKAFAEQTPELAAKTFVELGKRLAPFQGRVPPLTEYDHQCLVAAAELDALPDDHWHENGRWIVRPRADLIWDRVKKRLVAEAEASDATSTTDKKRAARNAKRMEQVREKQLRKLEKGLEPR